MTRVNSSACVLVDGHLRAAAEEERFRRIKHWAGFPTEAIRFCLRQVGAGVSDVDIIAVNSNPRAAIGRKLLYAIGQRPDLGLIVERLRNAGHRQSIRTRSAGISLVQNSAAA